jgi:hypothetical protein
MGIPASAPPPFGWNGVKYNFGNSNSSNIGDVSSLGYGIRNIKHTTTTAAFSSTNYGQFRDMLEQRYFGRFYKTHSFIPEFEFGSGLFGRSRITTFTQPIQQTATITEGPIEITFVEQNSNTSSNPLDTITSSNLSHYATSSLPFFDDIDSYLDSNGESNGRNRSYDITVTI